jgi:hypothetical protein
MVQAVQQDFQVAAQVVQQVLVLVLEQQAVQELQVAVAAVVEQESHQTTTLAVL